MYSECPGNMVNQQISKLQKLQIILPSYQPLEPRVDTTVNMLPLYFLTLKVDTTKIGNN